MVALTLASRIIAGPLCSALFPVGHKASLRDAFWAKKARKATDSLAQTVAESRGEITVAMSVTFYEAGTGVLQLRGSGQDAVLVCSCGSGTPNA